MAGIRIIGLGKSMGDTVVTNDDLAKIVDTNDAWIREKSGIQSRYFANNKTNTQMASEAAAAAIADAGIDPEQIGFVLVATFTPDDFTPSTACAVCGELGLPQEIIAADVNGACTGFILACRMAQGLFADPASKPYGVVVGCEKISPFMDMTDRSTCVLFGDGAGAAVLEYTEDAETYFYVGCDPKEEILNCKRQFPISIHMEGQEVYRFAVSKIPVCINKVLETSGKAPEDVDYFVCHQANERIIDAAARRMKGQEHKFYKNVYYYGNTSAASIPLALADMKEEGLLEGGKSLIGTGFGAGLTFASMYVEVKRGN